MPHFHIINTQDDIQRKMIEGSFCTAYINKDSLKGKILSAHKEYCLIEDDNGEKHKLRWGQIGSIERIV